MHGGLDFKEVLNYVFEAVCGISISLSISETRARVIPSNESSGIGAI